MFERMHRNLSGTIQSDAKIKCLLEEHVWHKMMGWCKAARSEVSGMGLCKIVRGNFVVYDVFFPLQYGSSGYTELDDRALAKLQIALYNKKIPADHFRFWWHTHYNFNVFWSGTDDGNATTLAKANGEWELSLVINQAAEFRCRADFFGKVHRLVDDKVHVLVDNIEVFTIPDSKRHRTKPNYRRDVKRWVKDMSELPEKQRPKTNMCPMPENTPASDFPPYYDVGGKTEKGSQYNWRQGKWDEDWEREPYCVDCQSYWCQVDHTKKKEELPDRTKEKRYSDLEDGDPYGGYVWYKGFLIDPNDYKKKIRDAKAQTEETFAELADRIGEEVATNDIPCVCGDVSCVKFDSCEPCDLCSGRIQITTGYCPGCWNHHGGIDAKPKSEVAS